MGHKIAIIIPAYKSRFLRQTLDSMAAQTCRDFAVYVGDDASPEPLEPIVRAYEGKLSVTYHRFAENLGGRDLVAHWERCIALSREPLVWLFSDDDLLPPDGVERVLAAAGRYGTEKVFFRLPLIVVDAEGQQKLVNPPLPEGKTSDYAFLLDKLNGRISSAAIEYVFSRDVWRVSGGFVKFPLAWCSDDATWARFARYAGGMTSVPGAPVCWRNAEGENISNSSRFDREKLCATTQFIRWIARTYKCRKGDSALAGALGRYAHTILRCSVRGNYGLSDLLRLCAALGKISPSAASYVCLRHLFHIKRL